MLPNIKHPAVIHYKGIYYQVFSYAQLTRPQAQKIVRIFIGNNKPKKKDQGKTIEIYTQFDRDSVGLL